MAKNKRVITGADIVSDARRYLGVPYVYGGTSRTSGLDCSGLVLVVCEDLGIDNCPRTSEEQSKWCDRVDSPSPGDLVFLVGSEVDPPPGHVGIVSSAGRMINEPYTGAVCRYDTFSANGTGVNKVMGYGRIPRTVTSSSANPSLAGQSGEPSLEDQAAGAIGGVAGVVLLLVLAFVALAVFAALIGLGIIAH